MCGLSKSPGLLHRSLGSSLKVRPRVFVYGFSLKLCDDLLEVTQARRGAAWMGRLSKGSAPSQISVPRASLNHAMHVAAPAGLS